MEEKRIQARVSSLGSWQVRERERNAVGNCVATSSVRSVVAYRPEREETTALLPVFSSYAAGMGKRLEACAVPTAVGRECEARGRSADESVGKVSGLPCWGQPQLLFGPLGKGFRALDWVATIGIGYRVKRTVHLER